MCVLGLFYGAGGFRIHVCGERVRVKETSERESERDEIAAGRKWVRVVAKNACNIECNNKLNDQM